MISIASFSSLLMLCGPAFAHHGTAVSYDESKTITLTGIVTKFVWSNPHAHILFDVTDENVRDPAAGVKR